MTKDQIEEQRANRFAQKEEKIMDIVDSLRSLQDKADADIINALGDLSERASASASGSLEDIRPANIK